SRQRLQSGLCLGFANRLPLAVGAMVSEVCQIGVLRREQPVCLGLGLRPRPGERLEGRSFSSRPELHGEHPGNRAVLESSGGQITKQPHDTLELLRVPTIVETIARSWPRRRTLLADNPCGDASGLTDLACCEIAPDTGQYDRLSISVLRGL